MINVKRICAGLYEVTTPQGVAEILHAERGRWFITYPGCRSADDEASTLAEAIEGLREYALKSTLGPVEK